MNDQIINGVQNAHGGWSKRKDHKTIAIIIHNADMIASREYFGMTKTVLGIEKLKKIVFNGVLKKIKLDIGETSGLTPWL
jgi:hypothetical protein